jgi:hypothetical protein
MSNTRSTIMSTCVSHNRLTKSDQVWEGKCNELSKYIDRLRTKETKYMPKHKQSTWKWCGSVTKVDRFLSTTELLKHDLLAKWVYKQRSSYRNGERSER